MENICTNIIYFYLKLDEPLHNYYFPNYKRLKSVLSAPQFLCTAFRT